MENLSIYWQALIVAFTQFLFIYYRTVNVNANIQKDRLKLFWSGAIVHISWVITTAIGVNAVIKGNYILVVVSLLSGAIGADLGLNEKLKLKNESIRKI